MPTSSQAEPDGNAGDHFNRHAVENGGLVAPLPDGFHSAPDQQGMTLVYPQILHQTLLADDRFQNHRSLDAGLQRRRRVAGTHLSKEYGVLHASTRARVEGA